MQEKGKEENFSTINNESFNSHVTNNLKIRRDASYHKRFNILNSYLIYKIKKL